MTMQLERSARCPFCGEAVVLLVDESAGDQCYIEDCEVCCNPMLVCVRVDADGHCDTLEVRRDNE